MDRKGLLIVIITLGIAAGWHFFYVKPRRDEAYKIWRVEKEKYDAEQAKAKAAADAAAPAPTPGATTPGATTPGATTPGSTASTPVEAATQPAKPAVPEEIKTLSSEVGTVDY